MTTGNPRTSPQAQAQERVTRRVIAAIFATITLWVLGFGFSDLGLSLEAQVAMPNPEEIHGKAIPAGELSDGTVTVRVVREALGNNVAGQDVTLTSEGKSRTVKTDEQGRAEFTNLPLGAPATAQAIVNGETLSAEPFMVPTRGGLRVILVAGLAAVAERRQQEATEELQAPVEKGVVVLGPNSRIVGEFQDDTLNIFYILDIVNNARARVDIGGPFAFDLPSGAGGAVVLEGSSPQAVIDGDRVIVTGPFAPGSTLVQVGYRLPNIRTSYSFVQAFPATMPQLNFALQKAGSLSMTSTQFSSVGEVRSDNGTPFLLGNGPALAANVPLRVEMTGIPAHSLVPRYAALGIAAALFLVGGWMAFRASPRQAAGRDRLVARRDVLLDELAKLEARGRSTADPALGTARRERILLELEQIYGELDETGSRPGGGGEGVAA